MKHYATLLFIFFVLLSYSQNRIIADGFFDDWENQPILFSDAIGDEGISNVDFGVLKIYNDEAFLFLLLETGAEINLQDLNEITMYLDTDNDVNTGLSINGIGAELGYSFGNRTGSYYSAGSSMPISHPDIGLVSAPTVTSNQFEIAIKRGITISGNDVFQGDAIKIVFKDNSSNGDILPSANEGIEYSFTNDALEPLPDYSIQKINDSDLRFLSYNVLSNGIFDPGRIPAFTRILQATAPDIIGFQEIYDLSSGAVADQVESMLPAGPGQQWYHAKEGPDCHAISKYPILESALIPGYNQSAGNGAFLIDIPGTEKDLLLIVAHPPCCTNNIGRQIEMDLMMQFIREAKNGNGPIPLEANAPIVILGDMNLVGDRRQLETLLTGNISDEAAYGPDFTPDWDGNDLLDANPYTTGLPFSYTWYSEGSSFSPGRLDFIIYSGSNLTMQNSYSLFTPALSPAALSANNLLPNDVTIASDHLPLVADLQLEHLTALNQAPATADFRMVKVFPNPSLGSTALSFAIPQRDVVHIEIVNNNGQVVVDLLHNILDSGAHQFQFDTSKVPAGVYFIKMQTSQFIDSQRLVILE